MTQACDLSTLVVEAGRDHLQGHPRLQNEFKAHLGSMKAYLKRKEAWGGGSLGEGACCTPIPGAGTLDDLIARPEQGGVYTTPRRGLG